MNRMAASATRLGGQHGSHCRCSDGCCKPGRGGDRRIRCFDYQLAQHYLQDFLNLFRAPGERSQQSGSTGGATTFIYRSHPSKPNDALMAVNYAFMLAKVLLGEPMLADLSVKIRLENCLLSGPSDLYLPNLPGAFSG